RIVSLLISDVPGDAPSSIASGPTVPDESTFADARAVLEHYRITPPDAVARHLREAREETPKPGDPAFNWADTVLVATARASLEAAAALARRAGYETEILGDDIQGEAREVGRAHARLALARREQGRRIAILSGGETTVTVRDDGRGGRNGEYLAALALARSEE